MNCPIKRGRTRRQLTDNDAKRGEMMKIGARLPKARIALAISGNVKYRFFSQIPGRVLNNGNFLGLASLRKTLHVKR